MNGGAPSGASGSERGHVLHHRSARQAEGNKSPKLSRKFKPGGLTRAGIASASFLSDFTKTVEYVCRSIMSRGKHSSFKDIQQRDFEEDCQDIGKIAHKREIQALLQLHRVLSEYRLKEVVPAGYDLENSLQAAISVLQKYGSAQEAGSLLKILRNAHLQGCCWTHDMIAGRKYEPDVTQVLGACPDDSSIDESTSASGHAVKIVRLIKNAEPLGATIKKTSSGDIMVARVIVGGVADRSGCIHVGDRIIEVNGRTVLDLEPKEVVKLLDAAELGSVTFKIIPNPVDNPPSSPVSSRRDNQLATSSGLSDLSDDATSISSLPPGAGDPLYGDRRLYVRAQFTYVPKDDPISPCPEAGLPFKAGDVLEILNQEDRHWWQARNAAETAVLRVGLIPSATLEERKQMIRSASSHSNRAATASPLHSSPLSTRTDRFASLYSQPNSSLDRRVMKRSKTSIAAGFKGFPSILPPVKFAHTPVSNRKFLLGLGKSSAVQHSASPPTGVHMFDVREYGHFESAECRTYEEVALLFPLPHQYRPVVLIGAPGVGRNELKRRLLMLDPEKYATTVPHTSRPPRPGETDGVDYNFVTREEMEKWIRLGFFIEYGEYKGNLYGTVIDSVHYVIDRGQVCLINPHPQAIRVLRNADLKPYIIFIRPPPFPALKESRCTSHARSTFTKDYSRGFTDEELQQMILSSEKLAQTYEHWFDYSLVNGNLEVAFHELVDVLVSVQNDPQWVPAQWVS